MLSEVHRTKRFGSAEAKNGAVVGLDIGGLWLLFVRHFVIVNNEGFREGGDHLGEPYFRAKNPMPVDTVVQLDIHWRMRQCRSSAPINRTQIATSNSHCLNERNEVSNWNRESGGSKQFNQAQ